MGKQNYREAIEKGRQEIAVQSSTAASRKAYRKAHAVKKKPEKRKNILLPALFFMFILLPVALLIYLAVLYEPDDTLTTSAVNDQVTLETNPSPSDASVVPLEEENKEKAEKQAKEAAEKEKAEKAAAAKAKAEADAKAQAAEKAKAEADAKAQAEAKAKAAAEAEAKAQAEAQAEEQAQAEAKAKAEAEAKAKAEKEAEEKKSASNKAHVVQPGETLYRIAVNTYGAAGANAGVEKIKQANGLSSNELTVGRTLILP